MEDGLIIKAYGGFYYVISKNRVWECKSRGKFKNIQQNIMVGDKVLFSSLNETLGKGVLEEILPRKNSLIRPSIANIDMIVLIMAAASPEPNLILLDRLLIFACYYQLTPVICFNKTDLVTDDKAEMLFEIYQQSGFKTIMTSSVLNRGIEMLYDAIKGKTVAIAGPSGVGKSSLLNSLNPEMDLKTGCISEKIQRGKHTTRHVELYPLDDTTLIADTPGFTSLDLPDMQKNQLMQYYPEMQPYYNRCRFSTCIHRDEPDCLVKKALEEGIISKQRYASYLYLLTEVEERIRRYYK